MNQHTYRKTMVEALKNKKCPKCGEKLSETTSMPVNNLVNVPGKDLTVLGYVCVECGEFVPAYLKIGPRTHTFATYKDLN